MTRGVRLRVAKIAIPHLINPASAVTQTVTEAHKVVKVNACSDHYSSSLLVPLPSLGEVCQLARHIIPSWFYPAIPRRQMNELIAVAFGPLISVV